MSEEKQNQPIVYVLETKSDITEALANDFLRFVSTKDWTPNENLRKEIIKAKQINDETQF